MSHHFHHDRDHHTSRAHREFESKHKASITHEIFCGAVAWKAAKEYEEHCAKHGKPINHAAAKAVFAGILAATIDRMAETKGLDAIDKHKAKKDAEKHAQELLASGY
ncbi:Protein of unknown function (DUF3759) domain containing protein [Lactarius tabidus]